MSTSKSISPRWSRMLSVEKCIADASSLESAHFSCSHEDPTKECPCDDICFRTMEYAVMNDGYEMSVSIVDKKSIGFKKTPYK